MALGDDQVPTKTTRARECPSRQPVSLSLLTNDSSYPTTPDDNDVDPTRPDDRCSLLLVRHGQSEWNAAGRWQGQADSPLSDLGRRQATAAASRLNAFDVIWASDLQRAQETARLIAAELDVTDIRIDARLRERDAGEWSGLTRPEIEERYPGFLDDGRRPEGWEYNDSLRERALAAVVDIVSELGAGGKALVATHGGLIYCLEDTLDTEGPRIPNLGARELLVGPSGIELGDRYDLLDNDMITTSEAP